AGSRNAANCLDRPFQEIVVHHDLQFDLAEELGLVFVTTVTGALAALLAITLGVAHSHPLHAAAGQCLAHRFQFRRLNQGDHHFHGCSSTPCSPEVATPIGQLASPSSSSCRWMLSA